MGAWNNIEIWSALSTESFLFVDSNSVCIDSNGVFMENQEFTNEKKSSTKTDTILLFSIHCFLEWSH